MQQEAVSQILDATPVTPPAGEPTTPVTTPETKPDDRMSGKLEILIRREQQALMKERQVKDLESSIQEKLKLIERFEEAKKGNSKIALELLGMDYNQLSESILKDGSIPAEVGMKKLEDEILGLKRERESDLERQANDKKQLQAQAETQAIGTFKTEINTYLSDNKERYELIDFEAQQDLVFGIIDEHYTRTLDQVTGIGKVMSIKEAADKVEEYLEKKYDKAKQVAKVKTLWGAIPKGAQESLAKQFTQKSTTPKTLTNEMSATPQSRPIRPPEDQRVKGILAEFLAKRGQ